MATDKTFTIVPPQELTMRLIQPVKGAGGWQSLMTDLQHCLQVSATEGPKLTIPASLLSRMIPYSVKFGSGGYQGIIRWVICLVVESHANLLLTQGETGISFKPTAAAS